MSRIREWSAAGEGTGESPTRIRRMVAAGTEPPRVAILGAGAGGLCMALQLQDAGIDTFTIYEKSDGVGGTWRDNTYPGAACDVPSHLYSFSFAPKTDWTRKFAEQPEILGYFESLVRDHGLEPHLRFGVEIASAEWSDERQEWELTTTDGETMQADVVVSGLGQLNRPYVPELPGLDDFEGTWFHSARWDHDHDLRAERVAVVGIGASAIQFVPRVAQVARQLTLFQRSVNYVAPKPDRRFRTWERWLLDRVPVAQRAYRASIYWRFEARFQLMRKGSRLGALLQDRFGKEVRKLANDRLPAEVLVPDYTPGCRRILIANDWYPTLRRPDVEVVGDSIERVTRDAIVTSTGRVVPVDTIIFGTGFHSTEFLSPLKITGRGGCDLNKVWASGAEAHLGMAVPGFPNFFVLYGPNTNLGHNSILFMIEQQVGFIRSLIAELMAQGAGAVEVTDEAMQRYESEILAASERTVWAEDCSSWYKDESGRITNNWPDYSINYWRRLRRRRPGEYRFEPATQLDRTLT